ncbi:helix-turn-helix domain-containing protein [Saccharibacillus sp. CPCC 101409]|uniref:AraC family transcriptional regulator n=1 Tax=Saccharibacillus sp. CPCC 101409 TaxID=3058041 RepID=UPI002671DE22|nr:helix-turn-helix domain-containing protein [Saccharibacillus sp. CPCC 101409]MDO3411189.1 helix-turn-helix domain-containing protein [Saccharibacillus sp. CPCC 101409]
MDNKEKRIEAGGDSPRIAGGIETIDRVLDEVERRLADKVTLDELARHVHLSKFYLHRLMRAATGLPLMEYIRARKLSASAHHLLGGRSDATVLDTALSYGFEHEQSYIRSFKRQFGVTPAQFRRGAAAIPLVEKYDTAGLHEIRSGVVFEPTFVMKPRSFYAGRQAKIVVRENMQQYTANAHGVSFYYSEYGKIPNNLRPSVYIGLTLYRDEYGYDATDYLTSAEVSSLEGLESEWDTAELPPGKYAVFKYIGGFHPENLTIDHLNEIWGYMDQWIERSPYEQAHGHHFEYIDGTLAREDYCEADLYLPIRDV